MCKYLIIFVFLSYCSSTVWSSKCDRSYGRYHVETITSRNLSYGYSPFYDKRTNSFYFVDSDVVDPCLYRYDLKSKKLYEASIDNGLNFPSFMFPLEGSEDEFVCGIDRTLVIIKWDGVSPTAKYIRNAASVEQDPIYNRNHFDTAKPDPKGRLYAGTFRYDYCPASSNPNTALYLFEKNGNVETLVSDLKSLTGLAFNKKKKLAYTLDKCNNYLSEYEWSSRTGRLRNWRKVFTFPGLLRENYFINGMDIDACGDLYVGLYNSSQILQIDPRSGTAKRSIHLPVNTISGIAFAGSHLDCMLVTTTTLAYDYYRPGASHPLSSSPLRGQALLVCGLGVKGARASKRPAL